MYWFCFILLCDWSGKLAPLFQPITYKNNHDLVACVFLRFMAVFFFKFEFSLDLQCIFLPSDWLLKLLWFWFYDTQSKSALRCAGC